MEPEGGQYGKITLQKNLIEALKIVKKDIVLIMEDDDWYSPFYIENMIQKFLTLNHEGFKHDLIGAAIYSCFNISNLTYHVHQNINHSSLCQVAFAKKIIPQINILLQYYKYIPFFDLALWNYIRGNKTTFLTKSRWFMGIKGMPGRPGVMDEHKKFYHIQTKNSCN